MDNIEEMSCDCTNPASISCFKGMDPLFVTVFLCTLFYVWTSRNLLIHKVGWTLEEATKSFNRQVLDFVADDFDIAEGPSEFIAANASTDHLDKWSLPSQGWLKINTDASVSLEKSAMAFTVRDSKGDVIEMASKISGHCNAFEA